MPRTPRHRSSGSTARALDLEAYELLLEAPEGEAEIHLPATMSALELHRWLASRLGYSPELPYTLTTDAEADAASGDAAASHDPRALLGGLGLTDGSQLLYDLGDDGWGCNLTVRVVGDRVADEAYPRVVRWDLPATINPVLPDDLDDDELPELDEDLRELEAEIEKALEAFDPTDLDDAEDDTIPAATLEAQLPLARRLLVSTRSRQEQAFLLSERLGVDVDDWVWALLDELEDSGREADALALLEEASLSRQLFPEVRSRRALLLVALGRSAEARPLVEALLVEGDHPDQRYLAGQALDPLIELGELRRAETLAYELRRGTDLYARYDAVDALIKVYQLTSRKPQARKLEREAARLAGEIQRAEERAALAAQEDDDDEDEDGDDDV